MAPRRPSRTLAAVVLAAGEGKRMKSAKPKVLHEVCGRPALWHVVRAALAARPSTLVIVVGRGGDQVQEAIRSWNLKGSPVLVRQRDRLGTGHAVGVAEDAVGAVDDVLVLPGDDPLVTGADVRAVLRAHRRTGAAATIAIAKLADPRGYARIVRDGSRLVRMVVETVADTSPAVRGINDVSTLVYALRREDLYRALPLVSRDNIQREYYLPDVISILLEKGERVSVVPVDWGGAMGLNSRRGMAAVALVMRDRILEGHMGNGVTFVDPDTAYVDVDVRIGRDTVIHPSTILSGATRIGAGCHIGPSTRIVDSTVGDGAEVQFSVVRGSRIGRGATVGPFASLRPGTVLEEGSKAGTFVEVKASRVGRGSKVPHLTYIGDATIGKDTNVGAGTVTVNYDGFEKHRTTIGDEVHIGSDNMLVAPVRIGNRAWTGAGSVITRDVPPGALAVERAEQRNVPGYDERKRAARAKRTGTGRTSKEPNDETRGGRRRGQ
jgi:bifunctional UDP-N-acetylglucosamine pyrophosphorylase / glucosamine-1-phosphate N-acetyltransferase